MSKKQKRVIARIALSGLALPLFHLAPAPLRLWLYLAAYLLAGYDVLLKAARNIAHGQVFDENFLMCIATVGAFLTGEYPEAVFVMLFYQVGALFESYAVGKSRASIAALMDIRPDMARVRRGEALLEVSPEEVAVGETIVVSPGERIPLDGVVCLGRSTLDTAALTGESLPRDVAEGSEALSGCINRTGVLEIRVAKEFGESTVSKILELVEHAASKKAKAETFITHFARYYTPCVVIGAALLAILPPLLTAAPFTPWLHRALIFLVISCPCALVISVPLGFFGGIGGASRRGILIKGSNYMETLANTQIIVMDKTGTLTEGSFTVQAICPENIEADRLIELAALAEAYSSHPIAQSLRQAFGGEIELGRIAEVTEIAGQGVTARIDGTMAAVGNAKLMAQYGIQTEVPVEPGTAVYAALETAGQWSYAGYIRIADTIKPDAAAALASLHKCGIRKSVMLTGDAQAVAEYTASQIGIDEVHAGLLPEDKVAWMERLKTECTKSGTLAFVGDGINDAPVLAQADIGIAMGGLGSDAAIEAADIVIMDDRPSKISVAIGIARRTLGIVKQNIWFALAVKFVVLLLGALGRTNMWGAVFADVGVSVIAILNSMRALKS
ncbi:MAG: cadmium-translocating P-type ATPase [Christensenellaceae bacterium]|jgi:Cd2+/Zn2+-exporting ATPase|nr:cadmium-translocating P-type ATPase [Christensenellaceae bacterium]